MYVVCYYIYVYVRYQKDRSLNLNYEGNMLYWQDLESRSSCSCLQMLKLQHGLGTCSGTVSSESRSCLCFPRGSWRKLDSMVLECSYVTTTKRTVQIIRQNHSTLHSNLQMHNAKRKYLFKIIHRRTTHHNTKLNFELNAPAHGNFFWNLVSEPEMAIQHHSNFQNGVHEHDDSNVPL